MSNTPLIFNDLTRSTLHTGRLRLQPLVAFPNLLRQCVRFLLTQPTKKQKTGKSSFPQLTAIEVHCARGTDPKLCRFRPLCDDFGNVGAPAALAVQHGTNSVARRSPPVFMWFEKPMGEQGDGIQNEREARLYGCPVFATSERTAPLQSDQQTFSLDNKTRKY